MASKTDDLAAVDTASRKHTGPLVAIAIFLSTFTLYFATAERDAVNIDAWAASTGSWALATTGTPWLDGMDVYQLSGTHEGVTWQDYWVAESANGHLTPQRMAGPVVLGAPFYWLMGSSGASEADFSLRPAALAASLTTALVVLMLYLAMVPRAGRLIAAAGVLAFAFTTPTWTISANGLWTHPVTQLGVAGAAFAASRSRWWLAGVFLGVGMWGRPHLALIAAVLGLGLAWSRRDWRVAAKVAIPTLASLGALVVWNHIVHGIWSIGGSYGNAAERATSGLQDGQWLNYLGFLGSPNRGILVWTPVLLLFVPAVFRARKHLPDWSWWLVAGALVYSFFQLRLNHYSGGVWFYSYRHALELLTALIPLLIFATPWLGSVARRALPILLAVQFAAMSIGAVKEGFFLDLEHMWTDNSFWFALRTNPELVGVWLVVCLAIMGLTTRIVGPALRRCAQELREVSDRHVADRSTQVASAA